MMFVKILLAVCILVGMVGPGLVPTSPAFVRTSAKNGKSGPHCWWQEDATQFAQQFVTAVTAPPLVGCVVWSHTSSLPLQPHPHHVVTPVFADIPSRIDGTAGH